MLASVVSSLNKKVVVALTSVSLLAGCMEEGTLTPKPVNSIRKDDPCVSAKAPFEKLRNERNQRIAGYAALGGIAAAALAKRSGANSKQTLIVGVLGAAGGATLGYYYDKEKRLKSTTALRSAVRGDAQRTVRSSDRLISALQQLNACRVGEVRSVVALQNSGKISKSQAEATLNAIRGSARSDNRLVNAVVGDLLGDQKIYVNALLRSGDNSTQNARSAAANYKPRVVNPQLTAGSRTISNRPISVARSRSEGSVSNISYAAKELDAGGDAHVAAVEDAISVANELLI